MFAIPRMVRAWGHHYRGRPGPRYANASWSRRRMTPLSRSDPALNIVLSRQRFVRWSQGPRHGGSGLAPDFPSNQPRLRSTLTLMKGTTFSGDGVGDVGIVGI